MCCTGSPSWTVCFRGSLGDIQGAGTFYYRGVGSRFKVEGGYGDTGSDLEALLLPPKYL